MDLDMRYIDEWSFWLDLKILAQTIPAVVKRGCIIVLVLLSNPHK